MMKKRFVNKRLLQIFSVFALFTTVSLIFLMTDDHNVMASAPGASASFTGAPGENNCTACHSSSPVNSGSGTLELIGIPETYSPGQQVTVTVKLTDAEAVLYGFQLTAVDETGAQAGTFTVPATQPVTMQIITGIVGPFERKYIEQTVDGLFTEGVFGSNTWVFTWTAPMEPVGKIDFYAAGNGGNSDGSPFGDFIYTTSESSLPTAAPLVSISGGVFADDGRGLRGAKVVLTDPNGVQRIITTSSFGTFIFEDVEPGFSYRLAASSKLFRFPVKMIDVNDNVTGINFIGLQ